MAGPVAGIRVRGLKEFQRALRKADVRLASFVRTEFKAIAAKTALRAREFAGEKTERRTGDLLSGIRPYSRQGGVGVRSGALHASAKYPDGYSYPRRLEFEGHGSDVYGPRASLFPAAEESEGTLEAEAYRVLTEMTELDLGGTPL